MSLFDLNDAVASLRDKKLEIYPIRILKSGKEAQVHLVEWNSFGNGTTVIVAERI